MNNDFNHILHVVTMIITSFAGKPVVEDSKNNNHNLKSSKIKTRNTLGVKRSWKGQEVSSVVMGYPHSLQHIVVRKSKHNGSDRKGE